MSRIGSTVRPADYNGESRSSLLRLSTDALPDPLQPAREIFSEGVFRLLLSFGTNAIPRSPVSFGYDRAFKRWIASAN